MAETLYQQYIRMAQTAADLNNAAALLQWDQEVYMPAGSGESKARQLATLATQAHELLTAETYGDLLHRMNPDELTEPELANVRLSLEDFEKSSKLSAGFVGRLSEATSKGFEAWQKARANDNFSAFLPALDHIIELKKEQAALYGFAGNPYDGLLDDYEKGATTTMLDGVFERISKDLPPLLERISAAKKPDDSFFRQHFPKELQWQFSVEVLSAMGYDWSKGRQDYSAHPFTTSFGPDDVRITTRVDEQDFASMFWSSVHEGGHALYEQGLPLAQYGLPLGCAASLSIHESQSRLWENGIARSLPFWTHFYPRLQQLFPAQLGSVSLDKFYRGANLVAPSPIRTEADELSYHFHVMIRYRLEKDIISGALKAKNLPEAWNDAYGTYLGIAPTNNAAGVLQDVHWSHGSFGYFPTYSLGSFYAAQLLDHARSHVPEIAAGESAGSYKPLLAWLRHNIHAHGRRYTSEELCTRITGRGLDIDVFMNYLQQKYAALYGF